MIETAVGSHLETGSSAPLRLLRGRAAPVDGAWEVKRRTIVLDANVPLDKNLSVFL
jgi:hypothetical protein